MMWQEKTIVVAWSWGVEMKIDSTGAKRNFFKWVGVLKLDVRAKLTKTIHLITGKCYLQYEIIFQ